MRVIMFTGSWCQPCKQMKPTFLEVVKELGVEYDVLDVSEQMNFARQCGVRSVPAVVIVEDGVGVLDGRTGLMNREQLVEMIEGVL